ncbi:MAG: LysR family transcriptional regulator [Colwellia sp.]|nr:LysR family transcriptional regulator [Colwellia sp.]
MALSQIDFKLLLCLNSLLKNRSVSMAADEMNMSQPAMSRALAKLRTLFGDPLFVRSSLGMEPTHRALSLSQPLSNTLDQMTELLSNQSFTPETCKRNFRLHMSSYLTQAYLPAIAEKFYKEAPDAQLEVIDLKEKSLFNQSGQNIDLAMCSQAMQIPEYFHQIPVGEEFMQCFMSDKHPLNGKKMTMNDYLNYSHIMVTLGGGPNIPIQNSLTKLGRARKVGLRVSHYLGALEVLSRTNMLFSSSPLVPDRFAEQFSITSQPLPFKQDSLRYLLVWPPTVHKDPAQKWLRNLCANVIKTNS